MGHYEGVEISSNDDVHQVDAGPPAGYMWRHPPDYNAFTCRQLDHIPDVWNLSQPSVLRIHTHNHSHTILHTAAALFSSGRIGAVIAEVWSETAVPVYNFLVHHKCSVDD